MGSGYLDQTQRRRVATLLLLAGVVLGALALADIWPFDDPPTDEERVEAAVEDLFEAVGEGDFKSACGQLAVRPPGCAKALEERAGKGFRKAEAKVTDVRVSLDRAVAEVEISSPGRKEPQVRSLEVERQRDGEWRISDLGG